MAAHRCLGCGKGDCNMKEREWGAMMYGLGFGIGITAILSRAEGHWFFPMCIAFIFGVLHYTRPLMRELKNEKD